MNDMCKSIYHTAYILCIGPSIAIATYRPSKNYIRQKLQTFMIIFVKIYSSLIYSHIVDLIVGFNYPKHLLTFTLFYILWI